MKKIIKLIILALALSLTVAAFALSSFADGEAEAAQAFSVYDKDGNKTDEGTDLEQLRAMAASLADGSTIVLETDMMASNALYFASTEESPRVINMDLNGKKIYTTRKITPALINTGSYTTFNLYSSVEGGVLYCANLANDGTSGNVFNVRGYASVLNVGDFTKGDVTYPGTNLRTYSAALIDIVVDSASIEPCDSECRFNVTRGSYYSIHTDYSGYIIPRGGEIVMNITDADIISMETKAPINSAGGSTVLNMTRCRIFQYESLPIALFNNALGTVNMKDCISSYAVKAASASSGILHLEGKNVFAVVAEGDYNDALIADFTNKTPVTTYADFTLASGGTELEYYDNTANFNRLLKSDVPKLKYPAMFVNQEDVVRYKFVKSNDSKYQNWSKYEKPAIPYELPVGGEEGVYKYGWQKSVSDDGVIVYKMGYVADYNLKVKLIYSDGELYFKMYVPADIIDGDHIDFVNVSIHGESYPAKDWEAETIDGVKYYSAISGIIYPEFSDEVITVRIPCDYGSGIYVDTTWTLTLSSYIDRVLATEAEGVWSAEQYATVKEIRDTYFKRTEEQPAE